MRITRNQIRQIIKEELGVLTEQSDSERRFDDLSRASIAVPAEGTDEAEESLAADESEMQQVVRAMSEQDRDQLRDLVRKRYKALKKVWVAADELREYLTLPLGYNMPEAEDEFLEQAEYYIQELRRYHEEIKQALNAASESSSEPKPAGKTASPLGPK